jgi:FkbM family methyltransferase
LLVQLAKPGTTVVEIGSNIGVHAIPLAQAVGPTGRLIAFEPQRILYQMPCANIALNGLTNVWAHQKGVGREKSTTRIPRLDYAASDNFGGISLSDGHDGEAVDVIPLDALALPACDLIKIDVEGMECEAINGAVHTVTQHRPYLYVENDWKENSARLIGQLLDLDYRLYWHFPTLFSADNFYNVDENIFQGVISTNMFCVPRENTAELQHFIPVTGPDDSWQAALERST